MSEQYKRKSDSSMFKETIKVLGIATIVILLAVHLSKEDIAQITNYEYGVLKALTAWLGGHLTYKLGLKQYSEYKEELLVNYLESMENHFHRNEDHELIVEVYSRTKAINNAVYALCILAWSVCLGFSL